MRILFVALIGGATASATAGEPEVAGAREGPGGRYVLWYDRPAGTQWYAALPIGNGRLGAMVFGNVEAEHLQLNEDTIWSGGPYQPAQASAFDAVRQARELVFAGTHDGLQQANDLLLQKAFGRPLREASYLPLGDLALTMRNPTGPVTDYARSLDLDTAVATTRYKAGDVTYTREAFASAPDHVIVVRISADRPGSVSFDAAFASPLRNVRLSADGDVLTLTGNGTDYGSVNAKPSKGVVDAYLKGAIVAHARLATRHDGGSVAVTDRGVTVSGANSATLLVAAATNFVRFDDVSGNPVAKASATLSAAAAKTPDQLLAAHLADHRSLFRRVSIDLGRTDAARLPTDQRVANFAKGTDPDLAALYFQFGRYLLIASSRPGGQPANLQGLWSGQNWKTGELDLTGKGGNSSMQPAWGSKYTTNINAEMNYWPAETTNLSECAEPLFQMVRDLSVTGAVTARTMYHARGWVLHHNTDIWRGTAPVDWPPTGMWTTGGAWVCTHLWEHYQFTGDQAFLAFAYPIMRGAAEFFCDFLVEDPRHPGWMVTCPAYSPENGPLTAGPAMDNGLLRDLFGQTAEAAKVLGVDEPFRAQILDLRAKLPPFRVGRWGQFQEWLDDRDSPGDHNRHVSQLYALFPSGQITRTGTPDLFDAAKVTLNGRGDAGTGWSLAWKVNFWARLLDGDHAYLILTHLLDVPGSHGKSFDTGGGTYPNLFDAHPPFQIDGNFGAASGIAEMLLQSHERAEIPGTPGHFTCVIDLLPALPKAWPDGSVTGLRARGGFEVDVAWHDRRLTEATVRSTSGGPVRLRYGSTLRDLTLGQRETFRWSGK